MIYDRANTCRSAYRTASGDDAGLDTGGMASPRIRRFGCTSSQNIKSCRYRRRRATNSWNT